jgi:nicotinate-nucleotide adenylyltransferase
MPRRSPDESPDRRRIGLLGGTFDPPHIGHLVAALHVRHQLGLDEVRLVVANEPWQKVGTRSISPAPDRLAMVRAAVAGLEGIDASDMEIRRGGSTYTVDTVHALLAEEPSADLHVVVGADAAAGLPTWKDIDEVRRWARLVVVTRPGVVPSADGDDVLAALRADDRVAWVEIPRLDIESNDIRARFGDGRPVEFLVPPGVASVIRERALYGGALV